MDWAKQVSRVNRTLLAWYERIIALALLIGIAVFFMATLKASLDLDWSSVGSLHEIWQRVLMVTIGLELVRTLISHNPSSLVNLLSFVIARRVLEPQTAFWEVPLGVAAFAALMATRRYLMPGDPPEEDDD